MQYFVAVSLLLLWAIVVFTVPHESLAAFALPIAGYKIGEWIYDMSSFIKEKLQ